MSYKVAVIMDSDSDLPTVQKTIHQLVALGIPYEAHIMSAHRTPDAAAEFSKTARASGFGVIIAAAGMAAHLAGVLAAHTTLPVIGIPCSGGVADGLDAMLSTIQMPPGIPVAAVGVNAGANAALLAAQMLALSDEALAQKLAQHKRSLADAVEEKDRKLQEKLAQPE